jgi:hypothetical protein
MAQNREQRFATAADMRKALHRTEQTATVINRGEAQTVLFPPAAPTVAATTEVVEKQPTVAAGETTVIRPLVAAQSNRRVLPWAISGFVVLALAACVVGFIVMKQGSSEVSAVNPENSTPAPTQTATPTPEQVQSQTPTPEAKPSVTSAAKEPTPKKTDKPARSETPDAATPTPTPTATPEEHEARDPGRQTPGQYQPPRAPRPPNVRVMPGGVTIRNFPDGSQLITSPDGMRVLITPDGKRKVLNPGRRPNKQKPNDP